MSDSTRVDVPDDGGRPTGRRRRRPSAALVVAALVAAGLAVAGCGGGSDDAASTTAPATTTPASTAAAPAPAGEAAVGKEVFAATCNSCHAGMGNRPGIGPQLAARGLTAAFITATVKNGRGPMPAGLVSGQELADVVAYVETLQ